MIRKMIAMGLLAALVSGCSSFTSGTPVVRHDKGNVPIMSTATEDGQYALYGTFDAQPVFTANVKKGEPLGFKMSAGGKFTAVGGTNEQQVNDGSYVWKKK